MRPVVGLSAKVRVLSVELGLRLGDDN